VDRLCAAREWEGLLELRDRAHRANRSGRQLWPAAAYAEYRLALEAPGRWAGAVLVEGAGRFALGPLPEVAASTHTWAELAPHLAPGPAAVLAAHERVVRGEDLTGAAPLPGPPVLDLPLRLAPWEPTYPSPVYRASGAEFPTPPSATELAPVGLPPTGRPLDDPEAVEALLSLVEPWVQESNGQARAVGVEGDAPAAVAALTGAGGARATPVAAAEALAWCGWAGASGGAHGHRRGAAVGRFGVWWLLAALTARQDPWPPDAVELGRATATLRWWRWQPAGPLVGWELHLAVEDPATGRAWALAATDRA